VKKHLDRDPLPPLAGPTCSDDGIDSLPRNMIPYIVTTATSLTTSIDELSPTFYVVITTTSLERS
jgi:hypothetical protein